MEPLIFIAVVVFAIICGIFAWQAEKKRREELAALAAQLGLRYSRERDHNLAVRFGFLNKLAQGANRYAFNILSGQHQDHNVTIFDYHYETYSRNSKGHRQTHHHYLGCLILTLDRDFPELTITEEGLFSKIAQFVGYDDIDFESAEFSKQFCVRSADKKFAYDVCHTRMMEYLLANPDLNVEIDVDCLAIIFGRRLEIHDIPRNLERLLAIRKLMPEYLWNT
ncbi:MAG: hypothetical protein AB1705_28015 [Verrucomicrobiota bacterium]